jgi:hypothetical protein
MLQLRPSAHAAAAAVQHHLVPSAPPATDSKPESGPEQAVGVQVHCCVQACLRTASKALGLKATRKCLRAHGSADACRMTPPCTCARDSKQLLLAVCPVGPAPTSTCGTSSATLRSCASSRSTGRCVSLPAQQQALPLTHACVSC